MSCSQRVRRKLQNPCLSRRSIDVDTRYSDRVWFGAVRHTHQRVKFSAQGEQINTCLCLLFLGHVKSSSPG